MTVDVRCSATDALRLLILQTVASVAGVQSAVVIKFYGVVAVVVIVWGVFAYLSASYHSYQVKLL